MAAIEIKRKIVLVKIILALVFILNIPVPGYAKIPEPDHIIYGIAGIGVGEVSLSIDGESIASYIMGSNPNAGSFYILRVPMDSLDPQEPGTARPGDTAVIYADGVPAAVGEVIIGPMGSIQKYFTPLKKSKI